MDHKLEILQESLPKAMLKPLTPEAEEATPAHYIKNGVILIEKLPFRVGRESRVVKVNGRLEQRVERPKNNNSVPNNDLYLIDRGHRLNISREHFQIEKRDDGFYLVDRGSACGTRIESAAIGGDDIGGQKQLRDGDAIQVGVNGTPYVFQFFSFENYQVVSKQ